MPRALWVLGLLVAGFVLARYVPGMSAAVAFGVSGVAVALAGAARGWLCRAVLAMAVVGLGYGYFALRVTDGKRWPWEGVVKVEGVVPESARIETPLRDPMAPFSPSVKRTRFELVVKRGEFRGGRAWVVVEGVGKPPKAGAWVRVTGMADGVEPALSPGERDGSLRAAQDSRLGYLRVSSPELVQELPTPVTTLQSVESAWLGWRDRMSERAHHVLLGGGPKSNPESGPDARPTPEEQGRALLGALILGDDDRTLRDVRQSFNRLGLAHVLSISGFHIAVMCGVVLMILRLGGDIGWMESSIASLLILAYLAILPFNAPVWRSAMMVLGMLAAQGLGRRHDRLAILAWMAVLILLYRPLEAWSIGFQLSFGMVAILVWLGEFVHGRMFGITLRGVIPERRPRLWREAADKVARLASTSLLCGAVATPLVAYHTGLISPVAVLTSIVVVPVIGALLIAGYLVLLVGVTAPPLGAFASEALGVLSAWIGALVRWVDGLPGTSLDVPRISLALTLAATGGAIYWFVRGRLRDWASWALAAVIVAWSVAELRSAGTIDRSALVRVDTLAVGDGTCHLVRSGRAAMLWDCGSLSPGMGRRVVPRALRELGATQVPLAVVTHPNLDHFNALLDAASVVKLRTLLVGESMMERARTRPSSAEAFLFAGLAERGVSVQVVGAGDKIELGEVWVEFISPARGSVWPTDNDSSLVARVVPRRAERSEVAAVLLTGDIQQPAIDSIRREHPELRASVVELPHHGSAREGAVQFVMGLGPRVVMQSTGRQRAGVAIWKPVREQSDFYCTAEDGAAWAEVRKDGTVMSGAVRR